MYIFIYCNEPTVLILCPLININIKQTPQVYFWGFVILHDANYILSTIFDKCHEESVKYFNNTYYVFLTILIWSPFNL